MLYKKLVLIPFWSLFWAGLRLGGGRRRRRRHAGRSRTGGGVSYVDLGTWTGVTTSAALNGMPVTPVKRARAFVREARDAVKTPAVSPVTNPRHVSISNRVLSCHSDDTMTSYWKFNNLLVKCRKNVTSVTFVPGLQDSTWSATAVCFLCVIGVTNYRRVSDPPSCR